MESDHKSQMNYPAASSGESKTLNSVIPHLMRNPVRSSGFRLEFIPYLIQGRNDELAASGGEYNPKGFKTKLFRSLGIGIWNLFGIWSLELGI
jgi:hypothetical protein